MWFKTQRFYLAGFFPETIYPIFAGFRFSTGGRSASVFWGFAVWAGVCGGCESVVV